MNRIELSRRGYYIKISADRISSILSFTLTGRSYRLQATIRGLSLLARGWLEVGSFVYDKSHLLRSTVLLSTTLHIGKRQFYEMQHVLSVP